MLVCVQCPLNKSPLDPKDLLECLGRMRYQDRNSFLHVMEDSQSSKSSDRRFVGMAFPTFLEESLKEAQKHPAHQLFGNQE
jgi:hypothetical protein